MSIDDYQMQVQATSELKDFIKQFCQFDKPDGESLFIKCFVYLNNNYPTLKSYIKAQIIWDHVVLGQCFDF